jgi:Cof subfamily protein (haloacid dehalogenase superfamily)
VLAMSMLESQVSMPETADIRLLVLDIDGTISGESNTIRPPVLAAIRRAQARGIQVAIATGRMYCAALRFYEAVGSMLPLLAYQGAFIKEPRTNVLHYHWPVAKQTALQLLEYFEEVEQRPNISRLSIHFYIGDRLYVREMTPETEAYVERSGVAAHVVGDLRSVLDQDPTKVLALSHDPMLIDQLLDSLRQRYTPAELYFTKSVATFFEAANPQVNKGVAVKYLAETLLGLTAENVMAIGDNFNDIEMLEYARIGVAMGNAPAEVKAFANWTTADVERDGVAIAIEKFLL